MYHCHIHFYLVGHADVAFKTLKNIPPLERFTHTFTESDSPNEALTAQADVIFLALQGQKDADALRQLAQHRKEGSELILLCGWDQAAPMADAFPEATDLWPMPVSEEEVRFRFQRWQHSYKQSKDLWQADQFLEAIMDSTPSLIWYKDCNGVHEKVNRSFCRVVNKTRAQVEGQKHAYIWNVDQDDPACIESELEVMRKRRTCMSDETIQTGNGIRELITYKSPLYDLDGSVMGTVGIAHDVTKERAYERAIVEKNQTMEMLFATMDCGVICHSMDGKRIISINRAALQLLGYDSQEEMMRDGFHLIARSVMDEDKPRLRRNICALTKVGDSAHMEYRVQHKDGTILHILGNIKLIEENGELLYQRFLLDYTDQKRKNEEIWAKKDLELRYREQLFEIFSTFLADNVDDVYLMLDETGRKAEFVSPNIDRVLGISAESIAGDIERLGSAKYTAGSGVSYDELAKLEPGMVLEPMKTERVNPKTGEHKWFRESVYCVSIQGIKKIVVYISDRTQERLVQNTLSEALDIAKVANKAKSTFLSNVSHDIRTPMNAIMGFVTLLQEEAHNPEHVLEYTQKISAASQHLLGLINDVLDMNKIESGSAVLNISELNLAEIINELNTIIRPQAKAKDQSFEIFTTSLTNEHLLGDKLRINQILINILSNAVKYTQHGGKISMRVEELPQVDQNYSRIRFTVSDNGQGMSEEYQKVIFDPFTREQSLAWNKVQGTGLGMAITKSLVDLMNGSIKVTSALGKGSTFVVELELRIQDKEDDSCFWEKHNLARMIIADDDEYICQDIVKKMAETGVDTQYATGGAKAIEMIRTAREEGRPYDLILLDWMMPDLDGLATARLIRQNYPNKIPILLFSAYDWTDIEQEALEVGIKHFLPKPFFMSNFKDAIQRLTNDNRLPAPHTKISIGEGKHILVVDDIDVNRMILVKILNTLGATCDVAENGKEAVSKFESSPPGTYDLILMDIQMPVMNGYEATRAIRASSQPTADSIAIIALTANAFVDDIRDALDAGMDAHISKPIVLDQLKNTIQEVLDRKKQPSRPSEYVK